MCTHRGPLSRAEPVHWNESGKESTAAANPTTRSRCAGWTCVRHTRLRSAWAPPPRSTASTPKNADDLHVPQPAGAAACADGLVVHRRDGAPLVMVQAPVTTPVWTAVEVGRSLSRGREALATTRRRSCGTGSCCHRRRPTAGHDRQPRARGIRRGEGRASARRPRRGVAEGKRSAAAHDRRRPADTRTQIRGLRSTAARLWSACSIGLAGPMVAAEYDGVDRHSGPDAMRQGHAGHRTLRWIRLGRHPRSSRT